MLVRNRTKASEPTPQISAGEQELNRFRELLKLDRFALDTAGEQQSQLFQEISDKHSFAVSYRDEAKETLARIDAELASEVRVNAIKNNEKMTEGAIYDRVVQHTKHIVASADYESKRLAADQWNNLVRSFEMRGKMIQTLTTQYASGYFTTPNTVQPRQAIANQGREALHVARTKQR